VVAINPNQPGSRFLGRRLRRETLARLGVGLLALAACGAVSPGQPPSPERKSESVTDALCRLIDDAARSHQLPAAFLTRLIWRESSFRPEVVSRAGAQGVAQFMPGTARERGLLDPFDPEQAIPQSARLLSDLGARGGGL